MAVTSIELQTRLKKLGYDPGPLDNFYSDVTEKAVIAFQRDHGLDPNGYADDEMEALLFPELYADAETTSAATPKVIDEAEIRLMIKRSEGRLSITDLATGFDVSEDVISKLLRTYMIDQVDGLT